MAPTVQPEEFPHGLRCGRCLQVIEVGEIYVSVPLALDEVMSVLVCQQCAR